MTYNIDYSEPLRDGFTIAAGSFNGPGGAVASSSLRLYGRGALEWGESVDEDLLRLAENFNSATPPPYALGGQLWFQTKFYWLHTGTTWYLLDPDSPSAWTNIGPTGTNAVQGGVTGLTTPGVSTIGSYWYTAAAGPFTPSTDAFGNAIKANTLYRYDSAYQQQAPGWIERTSSSKTVAPVDGVDYPDKNLLVWDEFQAMWVAPPTSIASDSAPSSASVGSFWWDTLNDQLNVWDGSAWVGVILASGTEAMAADLDMGSFNVVNVADPSNPQDAMTLNYADLNYVSLGGDIMTGALTLPAQVYPLGNSDNAATITYVNGLATAVGTPGSGGFAAIFSGGGAVSHKPGDIYINTGTGRIWIAVTTTLSVPTNYAGDGSDANWKQVFPALYS